MMFPNKIKDEVDSMLTSTGVIERNNDNHIRVNSARFDTAVNVCLCRQSKSLFQCNATKNDPFYNGVISLFEAPQSLVFLWPQ